jgi:predicted thioesterase
VWNNFIFTTRDLVHRIYHAGTQVEAEHVDSSEYGQLVARSIKLKVIDRKVDDVRLVCANDREAWPYRPQAAAD